MLWIPMNKLQIITAPIDGATGIADSKLICSDLRWPTKRCFMSRECYPLRTTRESMANTSSHQILVGTHKCATCSVQLVYCNPGCRGHMIRLLLLLCILQPIHKIMKTVMYGIYISQAIQIKEKGKTYQP